MKTKTPVSKILMFAASAFLFSNSVMAQQEEKPPISVVTNVTNPTCAYSNDGQITLSISGGFPPYYVNGIQISGNEYTLGSLNNGDFNFYISDDFLTNASVSTTITAPAPLQVVAVTGDATTFGGNDGFVDLSFPVQTELYFDWSAPGMPNVILIDPNTEDQMELLAGVYMVTITEQNGCVTQKRFIIGQPQ
ncbi:MAG: hypothetical protein RL131_805 [Bacteroidota bacterium]